jgi:sugar lactone lactonase YvrE
MKTKLTAIHRHTFGAMLIFAVATLLAAPAASNAATFYVSDTGHNRIEKFTAGGLGSVFANTGLNEPFGLAFDNAGNLYVANGGNNTIEKFTPGGIGSVFANSGLSAPFGLAFDNAGNLYAANGNNAIEKFTPGGVGSVFASSGLNVPSGLAFDGDGNLYVVNQGDDTVGKFTSGGIGSVFVNGSGLFGPTYIAVQVPEPSSWALLSFCIPALVALHRQRERAQA